MRKAKKEYFQKLIEPDNNIASVWRALNVFTKVHRSTSADIPKNLTANDFNNHILSVSESLIEPRTNVYECSNPVCLCMCVCVCVCLVCVCLVCVCLVCVCVCVCVYV